MATLPKSQIDPGLPLQDPALLAWLRQYGLGVPQAGSTSPIMERLMQTTADPPAGLSDLPSRFYAPGYVPRTSTPSQINYSPMGFPEEASLQGGEGTDTLAGGTKYAMQGVRRQPLSDNLLPVLATAAMAAGVDDIRVVSGGQPPKGSGLPRKGSVRHDHGEAGDIQIVVDGRTLDFDNPADRPVFEKFMSTAVAAGAQGIGAAADYMGTKTIHIGFGSPGAWGAKGKIANAPAWVKSAWEQGMANPIPVDPNAVVAFEQGGAYPKDPFGVAASKEQPAVAAMETPVSPEQVAAIRAAAVRAADTAWPAQETAALALDAMGDVPPAQQAAAEMASGTGTNTLTGGIVPPTPRIRDQAVLNQNIADQLDEAMFGSGPHRGEYARGRPEGRWVEGAGGAPDASTVPMPNINPRTLAEAPAVGGPNDRRPQPPTPTMRPEGRWMAGAGGAPDAATVPNPNPRGTPYAPSFPSLYGEQPAAEQPAATVYADAIDRFDTEAPAAPPALAPAGDLSAAMGGPPSRSGDLSAAMGNAPPPPVNRALEIASQSPWQQERASRYLANDEMSKRTRMETELGGARPQAPTRPGPPLNPMDVFGGVDRTGTMVRAPDARTKDDFYSPPPLDFSVASDPAPVLTAAPSSPTGPIGNTISPENDRGAGRQAFVDANRTPVSVDYTEPAWLDLPDPTPPAPQSPPDQDWRDQFDISFSPGGPGEIYDLTPPQSPKPSTAAQGNPFDALMGPGAAIAAVPFNDVSQGVGAPDFSNADPASWWNSAPTTGNLGLEAPQDATQPPAPAGNAAAMADVLDEDNAGEALAAQALANAYASPGASALEAFGRKTPYTQAAENVYQPAGPAGGMDIRSPAAQTLSDEAPPPASSSAPMFSQPPAPAGGRLGPVPGSGPFGALFGGAGGGLMGKIGANWAGPQWAGPVTQGSSPYMYGNGMGTNDWWSGNTNAMGGSTGLSWTGSDGRTITAYSNDGGQTYTHGYGPGA